MKYEISGLHRAAGRLFHRDGPATTKLRRLIVVRALELVKGCLMRTLLLKVGHTILNMFKIVKPTTNGMS